jgi:glycosyltransferase involved in cell wall biosynthesis
MISVVIPAYNSSATIVEALDSVLAQSLWKKTQPTVCRCEQFGGQAIDDRPQTEGRKGAPRRNDYQVAAGDCASHIEEEIDIGSCCEVIVVDDCSTDDTVEVVNRWLMVHGCMGKENSESRSQEDRGQRAEGEGEGVDIECRRGTPCRDGCQVAATERASHIEEGMGIAAGDCASHIEEKIAATERASHIGGKTFHASPARPARMRGAGGRFTLHVLPVNGGPAVARNAGIALAKGEWIAFLDADDLWTPSRLKVQMDLMAQRPDVVMICGRPVPFLEEEQGIAESHERHGRWGADGDRVITREELSEHNPVATSTVLVRRSALETSGGFDQQFRGPEDYDLWLRLAAIGDVYYSSQALSRYRYGDLSLSTDDRKFLPQVLRVLEKAYTSGGALFGMGGRRRAYSHQYLSASWMAAEQGCLGRAWRLWLKAVWLWPFRYGRFCRLPWGRLKLAVRFCRIALGQKGVMRGSGRGWVGGMVDG